jgi:hypothetical protein
LRRTGAWHQEDVMLEILTTAVKTFGRTLLLETQKQERLRRTQTICTVVASFRLCKYGYTAKTVTLLGVYIEQGWASWQVGRSHAHANNLHRAHADFRRSLAEMSARLSGGLFFLSNLMVGWHGRPFVLKFISMQAPYAQKCKREI